MKFTDFIYYFGRIDVCMIEDKYLSNSYKFEADSNEEYTIPLTIITKGTYYITTH